MKNKDDFKLELESLTELEIADLVEVLTEHVDRNKMAHLVNHFNEDAIHSLEEKLSEEESACSELRDRLERGQEQNRNLKKVLMDIKELIRSV